MLGEQGFEHECDHACCGSCNASFLTCIVRVRSGMSHLHSPLLELATCLAASCVLPGALLGGSRETLRGILARQRQGGHDLPLAEVLNCLEAIKVHMQSRSLDQSTPYWLACCANRPHSLQEGSFFLIGDS